MAIFEATVSIKDFVSLQKQKRIHLAQTSPKSYVSLQKQKRTHLAQIWSRGAMPIKGSQTPIIDGTNLRKNQVFLFGYSANSTDNFVRVSPASLIGDGSYQQALQIGTVYLWQGQNSLRIKIGSPPNNIADGQAILVN